MRLTLDSKDYKEYLKKIDEGKKVSVVNWWIKPEKFIMPKLEHKWVDVIIWWYYDYKKFLSKRVKTLFTKEIQ